MNPKHIDFQYKEYLKLWRRERELRNEIKEQPFIEIEPRQDGWTITPYLRQDVNNSFLIEFFNSFFHSFWTKDVRLVKAARRNTLVLCPVFSQKNRYGYSSSSEIEGYVYNINLGICFDRTINKKNLDKYAKFISLHDNTFFIYIPTHYIKFKARPKYINQLQVINGELESEIDYNWYKILQYPQYQKNHWKQPRAKKEETYIKSETKRIIKEYYNSEYEALEEFNDYVGDNYSGFPEFKHLWSKIKI